MNEPVKNTTLVTAGNKAKAVQRFFRSIGPRMLSSSEKVVDQAEEKKRRLDTVEAGKSYMIKDAEGLAEIRKQLLLNYVEAEPMERIGIEQNLEFIEQKARRYTVCSKALDELEKESDVSASDDMEISPHWMDKFNELARAHNEDWREELLAKALAAEARIPGSIGPRALWLIGTMEGHLFHAFAALIDVSIFVNGYIIPNVELYLKEDVNVSDLDKKAKVSNLMFKLGDVHLFGDVNSAKFLPMGYNHLGWYGEKYVSLAPKEDLHISGLLPSNVGTALAKLYTPKTNALGRKIFDDWQSSLNKEVVEVQEMSTESGLALKEALLKS